MQIWLRDILPIEDATKFKVHFARWNGISDPLDVWLRSRTEWQEWQEYRPSTDAFNRPHIFSLIQIRRVTDVWLFGAVFDVVERLAERYVVKPSTFGEAYIGRLKVLSSYRQRATRVNLENHYHEFCVHELLPAPFAGARFPGLSSIDISFTEFSVYAQNNLTEWRHALENIKGVYLITDSDSGKFYVGSAYGESGIWSRWVSYTKTGHGGNAALRELQVEGDLERFRKCARLTLLEQCTFNSEDSYVIERESHWKRILQSRGDNGFNRN